MRAPALRDELQAELRARGVELQVIALDQLSPDLPFEIAPLRPHFNPFGRAEDDRKLALCELEKQWREFAPGAVYLIGECVDIALQWWLKLPTQQRPALRQITRSPWQVDGVTVRSRQVFAAPNQSSRYFLYNFEPPPNDRALWICEESNASVGALASTWFASQNIKARGVAVGGTVALE